MIISKKWHSDILLLEIIGSIDGEGREYLAQEINNLFEKHDVDKCIMDFTKVTYIGSIGIGNILQIYKRFESSNAKFCMLNILPPLRRVFRITQLDKIIPIFDSKKDAIKYLRGEIEYGEYNKTNR